MTTGGYEFKFTTDVPDRLLCKICKLASRDPHLSVCYGHIFCKTCIGQTRKSDHPACPMCRNGEFPGVLNLQIEREVKQLTIYCTNGEAGCTWEGEIRELLTHKVICPYEIVHCQYHEIGCEEKIYRKDLMEHNKMKTEEHLALSVTKLRGLEHLMYQFMLGNPIGGDWLMQLSRLSMMTATSGSQVCPVIVKVPEFTNKSSDAVDWYSNSFYSHEKGYKMCLNVCAAGHGDGKGTHLSTFLYLMKGPHDDELTWPLMGRFEIKLLNQVGNSQHLIKTLDYFASRVTDREKAIKGQGWPQFISTKDFHKATSARQYLKDDCIFLQVSKQA